MSLVYLLIAILVIMAMILLMSKRRALAKYAGYIALVAPVISSIYFLIQIPSVAKLQYLSTSIPWIKTLDINLDLRLDGLSLMFSLIISLIGIAVFFYATQYLSSRKDNLPRFYFYLTLFMFSMIGIVLSDNTILMYIFWELTSVSSFLLISYWYNNGDSQFGAIQSFMITVFGGLALLVGFIMLYIMTGTNNITDILGQADHIKNHGLFIPMIFMFLLGAFTKSAQFPFHIWLPRAMAAPTPVSAYLHFLNGFLSKEMFLDALTQTGQLSQFSLISMIAIVFVGVIASIFTFTYALYMVKEVFWTKYDSKVFTKKNIHEPWLFSLPSLILMVLVPVIFFVPNIFGKGIIVPALRGVSGGNHQIDPLAPHVSQWHGFNIPLLLTIIIILLGSVLAIKVDWKKVFTGKIRQISVSKGYEMVYRHFEKFATKRFKRVMQDRLNQYIIMTLGIFMIIIGYGYIRIGLPKVHQLHVSEFGALEIILAIVTVTIGISLIFIRQRLTMVILNGVIGFVVTLFFIAMKAPDLALTQLVVETITTILFIVSFSRLPNVPRSNANKKREIIKISVSLLMALIVVSLIFITQQTDGLSSISDFYLKADKLTGGKNIVNAILGDFRALDTLFEGLVLIITGLGIYTLLNYQDRRGQDERE